MRDGSDEEGSRFFGSTILTARLILRAPEPRDEAVLAQLSANPRVAENLAAAPGPIFGDGRLTFVVMERAGVGAIGATSYGPMAGRPSSVEVATWIGEPHWGKGYATEATQAAIDHAFSDERILVVWCANRATNARARRVIEKCGFQFRETGMMRSPMLRGAVPVERFALERKNWASLKAWANLGRRKETRDAPRDNAA